jgi:hypothetical protein
VKEIKNVTIDIRYKKPNIIKREATTIVQKRRYIPDSFNGLIQSKP